MEEKEIRIAYAKLVSACWADEALKERFKKDPAGVMNEYGIPLEDGVTYEVLEAEKFKTYAILPEKDTDRAVQSLSRILLDTSEKKGGLVIAANCELRLRQNTADHHYLVLPFCPQRYTQEDKLFMQQPVGDSVTVALDVAAVQTEAAVTTTTLAAEAEVAAIVFVGAFIVLI